MALASELEVDGKTVKVSHLDKVLFPAVGFSKAQLIDYYIRIGPFVLPHLTDRPITLKRFPDGIEGESIYEKDAPPFTPKWVKTAKVWRVSGEAQIHYVLLNDLASLVWSANVANIELHPFLARAAKIEEPTMLVLDLDPGAPAGVMQCAQVALWLKEITDGLGLQSFVKSSGSKGLHFYIPLNSPVTYEATQPVARALAQGLERQHPELIVSEMAKQLREGKVFIDWSQNANYKSTVAVYSLRAKRERPFVSFPLTWEEIQRAVRKDDPKLFAVEPDEAIRRCEKEGDLFAPVLQLKQRLGADMLKALAKPGRSGVSERAPKRADPKTVSAKRSKRADPQDLSLEAYDRKRNFSQTREPRPKAQPRKAGDRERLFVIQKHAASHLHYDFRLEMGGVLKSWAVPKGPPYTRNEKRLAMQVEDHPMDYARFEGIIPPGNYGAGTVMVWDIGTYDVMDGNLYAGKLHLNLKGKKLKGEWILVRADRGEEEKRNWFLIKGGTSMTPLTPRQDDRSALTGRSLDQIAQARDAEWTSNRVTETAAAPARPGPTEEEVAALLKTARRAPVQFVEPMLARLVESLPEGDSWIYEIKFDGYRAMAIKRGKKVELRSRTNKAYEYEQITGAIARLPVGSLVLDGEIVAVDSDGKPSFQTLQNWTPDQAQALSYYVFDLVHFDGRDLRKLPLSDRKRLLSYLARHFTHPLHFSARLDAPPAELVKAIREQGMEGVVAKKAESVYESGQRTGAWVKYKTDREQEFVIGGYRSERGARGFDALLVGYYERGQLRYAGKVKNGFTPKAKEAILRATSKLHTKKSPFAHLATKSSEASLAKEDLERVVWLQPKRVAQVRFVEWTRDGVLRHPSFEGLREDKDPKEVVREQAD